MINRIRQLFCKHGWVRLARHKSSSQNLFQCQKCKLFHIYHVGLCIGYNTKEPNLGGWISLKDGSEDNYGL